MGYFRLFYYIAYVLNFVMRMLKRHGKFILLAVCIFIFLVVCMYNPKSNAAYEGNTSYTDPNQLLFSTYNNFCLDFLRRYNSVSDNNAYKQEIFDLINNRGYNYYIYYGGASSDYADTVKGLSMLNQTSYLTRSLYICFCDNRTSTFNRTLTSYTYFGINNVSVSKFLYSSTNNVQVYYFNLDNLYKVNLSNTTDFELYMPDTLWFYSNGYIYEYFYNNMPLSDIEILYDMDQKLGQVTNTVQETQDYLIEEPSANDFSSSDLPSDSGVTDTTETGLTNIFSQIYNAFTGTPSNQNNIIVSIPFTGKSFTINYNLTSNIVNGFSNQWVKNIISVFWYYIISRYIILDLVDKFEKIQTGNIENLENENIKGDML